MLYVRLKNARGGTAMNYDVTTVIWVLVATALIYFMQAGFALCEAGLTRAKNTGNILMKNLMIFALNLVLNLMMLHQKSKWQKEKKKIQQQTQTNCLLKFYIELKSLRIVMIYYV
jgi:ammonia channel protein AmtB